MIYYKPAKHRIWGGLKVGPNEGIEELKKRGINITVRTLQNWVNAGSCAQAQKGAAREPAGSWADYPPETIPRGLNSAPLERGAAFKKS